MNTFKTFLTNEIKTLVDLFDWKKNPGNVFYIAIPLAILSFSFMLFHAFIQIKRNNDYVYLCIVIAALVILAIALIPAYRYFKNRDNNNA